MSKKFKKAVAMMLIAALVLLSGCTASDELSSFISLTFGDAEAEEMEYFDDIEYVRPDVDELIASTEKVTGLLSEKGVYRIYSALNDCFDLYNNFSTMSTIAYLRYCHDTSDSFYDDEYTWCDAQSASVSQAMDKMYRACAASGYAVNLETNYFGSGFRDIYSEESSYTDNAVALLEQESALLAQYRDEVSVPVIELNGQSVDLYEYLYSDSIDEYDYYEAVMAYYEQYSRRLGEIYIQLMGVREQLAAENGYDSYEQMQYEYTFERSYTPEEAEAYFASIKRDIAPLYRETNSHYEDYYAELSALSPAALYYILRSASQSFGGDIADAYWELGYYGVYDIDSSPTKVNSSFETYIYEYDMPYVFLNSAGDLSDIASFSHEFGHFCDDYINCGDDETLDLMESYSLGLEYLTATRYDQLMSLNDAWALSLYELNDILSTYVQQASFAEFEHRAYAIGSENITVEDLNAIALSVAQEYGYCEDGYEDYYAMSWIDITHFFEYPFYVVSYTVAADVALQMYMLETEEYDAGVEVFSDMLYRESGDLLEVLDSIGLESPFAEGRTAASAAFLASQLETYSLG